MAYTHEIKLKAENLRRSGWLYSQIAAELFIPQPTLHGWLKNIELTPDEKALVMGSMKKSQLDKVKQLVSLNRAKYVKRDLEVQNEANKVFQHIQLTTEYKKILCSVFFWCEGGKDISGGIQFINSDPILVETFLSLFRSSFRTDEAKFRAVIHLHDYHDPTTQLNFWEKVTGIPKQQFYKPFIKPHTGKQKKTNYPGCVSIRYLDSSVGKLLQMIYTKFGETYRGVR